MNDGSGFVPMFGMKAVQYYRYLRRDGLRPRTACLCTLMRYSETVEEYRDRLRHVAAFIRRIDIRRTAEYAAYLKGE